MEGASNRGLLILNETNMNKIVNTFKLSNFSESKNPFDYGLKTLGGEDFDLFAESGADGVEYYSGNTPDGMLIAFMRQGVVAIPTIIFDVNGQKGPNVVGRDIHGIYIIDNMVTPMYSRPYLRFLGFTVSDDDYLFNQNNIITMVERGCSKKGNGEKLLFSCLERIILDGWEMKY